MSEPLSAVVLRSRGAMKATDAAKAAGVSRSFWSDVEHGRRYPSRLVLSAMCGAVVGNWNEWLVAWADARLDGSLDDLRATLRASLVWRVMPDANDEGGESWRDAYFNRVSICAAEHSARGLRYELAGALAFRYGSLVQAIRSIGGREDDRWLDEADAVLARMVIGSAPAGEAP